MSRTSEGSATLLARSSAVLPCPHCNHIIEVPDHGGSHESAEALASWRLAEHINAVHRSPAQGANSQQVRAGGGDEAGR